MVIGSGKISNLSMVFSSSHSPFQEKQPNFQPYQIVSLKHENVCLYAEVVQVVEERQVCWARPVMLVTHSPSATMLTNSQSNAGQDPDTTLLDLRQGSDLLLPVMLFQEALDVEVLPLLAQLNMNKDTHSETGSSSNNQRDLNRFIDRVCRAYSNLFL
jgi:hypothetical protein